MGDLGGTSSATFRQDRRGEVWAFISVAILFIGMPLASLTVEVVRGMYVRTHLQVAAADAINVPVFRETGVRQKTQLSRISLFQITQSA